MTLNENNPENAKYIDGAIEDMEIVVKHGKPKVKRKKLISRVLKGVVPNPKQERIANNASKKATTLKAKTLKKISQEVQRDLENFG